MCAIKTLHVNLLYTSIYVQYAPSYYTNICSQHIYVHGGNLKWLSCYIRISIGITSKHPSYYTFLKSFMPTGKLPISQSNWWFTRPSDQTISKNPFLNICSAHVTVYGYQQLADDTLHICDCLEKLIMIGTNYVSREIIFDVQVYQYNNYVTVSLVVVFGMNSVSNAGRETVTVRDKAECYYSFPACIIPLQN